MNWGGGCAEFSACGSRDVVVQSKNKVILVFQMLGREKGQRGGGGVHRMQNLNIYVV